MDNRIRCVVRDLNRLQFEYFHYENLMALAFAGIVMRLGFVNYIDAAKSEEKRVFKNSYGTHVYNACSMLTGSLA